MANKHEPHPPMVQESAMDYEQHEQTYEGFVTLVKYSILVLAVFVVLLFFVVRP